LNDNNDNDDNDDNDDNYGLIIGYCIIYLTWVSDLGINHIRNTIMNMANYLRIQ
jgi:hypothetical protein